MMNPTLWKSKASFIVPVPWYYCVFSCSSSLRKSSADISMLFVLSVQYLGSVWYNRGKMRRKVSGEGVRKGRKEKKGKIGKRKCGRERRKR